MHDENEWKLGGRGRGRAGRAACKWILGARWVTGAQTYGANANGARGLKGRRARKVLACRLRAVRLPLQL